jgi:F-type H+-transporting ATPase subunit delta
MEFMNIPTKQYAKTLYKIIDGKSKNEAEKIIEDFVAAMSENNDLGKIKKIIEEFNKTWNREKGIVEAEILSAKELDKDIVKLLNSYIVKLSGANEVVLSERVDKGLLGGVVIRYGDKVLDGSLKTKINDLKNNLVK